MRKLGGAVHSADMISRMKQNLELLKNRRFFKRHIKSGEIDFSKHIEHKLHYEKASEKQLQKIRDEVIEEQRKIIDKKITILFVSVIITLFIALSIYAYMDDLLEFLRNFYEKSAE